MRQQKTDEFRARLQAKYGGQYEVLSDYVQAPEKMEFNCTTHGKFSIAGTYLLNRHQGCKGCMAEKSRKLKFTYSEVWERVCKAQPQYRFIPFTDSYAGSRTLVTGVCSEHGEFQREIRYLMHDNPRGCPTCAAEGAIKARTYTYSEFVAKATEVHGELYSYDEESYTKLTGPVLIGCKVHGDFIQNGQSHISGAGCPKCYHATISNRCATTFQQFVVQAKTVHGDRYTYLEDGYVNASSDMLAVCKVHGEFIQHVQSHLGGSGCSKCSDIAKGERIRSTFEKFCSQAAEVHNNKYTYNKDSYSMVSERTAITCPTHGEFTQLAYMHLAGNGCPKCAHTMSKPQIELDSYIRTLVDGEVKSDYRYDLSTSRREVDTFVPSKRFAVEFNGTWWHSSKYSEADYHLNKQLEVERVGIRLIQIFSDEWETHQTGVKNLIATAMNSHKSSVMAEDCKVVPVIAVEAREFHNTYNVKSSEECGISLGLQHQERLVAVLTLVEEPTHTTLYRYSTLGRVEGGSSKLFNAISYVVFKAKGKDCHAHLLVDTHTREQYFV